MSGETPRKPADVLAGCVEAGVLRERFGEHAPGERIAEANLAARFEVPRPTVRSALAVLQEQGLLRREPNLSLIHI